MMVFCELVAVLIVLAAALPDPSSSLAQDHEQQLFHYQDENFKDQLHSVGVKQYDQTLTPWEAVDSQGWVELWSRAVDLRPSSTSINHHGAHFLASVQDNSRQQASFEKIEKCSACNSEGWVELHGGPVDLPMMLGLKRNLNGHDLVQSQNLVTLPKSNNIEQGKGQQNEPYFDAFQGSYEHIEKYAACDSQGWVELHGGPIDLPMMLGLKRNLDEHTLDVVTTPKSNNNEQDEEGHDGWYTLDFLTPRVLLEQPSAEMLPALDRGLNSNKRDQAAPLTNETTLPTLSMVTDGHVLHDNSYEELHAKLVSAFASALSNPESVVRRSLSEAGVRGIRFKRANSTSPWMLDIDSLVDGLASYFADAVLNSPYRAAIQRRQLLNQGKFATVLQDPIPFSRRRRLPGAHGQNGEDEEKTIDELIKWRDEQIEVKNEINGGPRQAAFDAKLKGWIAKIKDQMSKGFNDDVEVEDFSTGKGPVAHIFSKEEVEYALSGLGHGWEFEVVTDILADIAARRIVNMEQRVQGKLEEAFPHLKKGKLMKRFKLMTNKIGSAISGAMFNKSQKRNIKKNKIDVSEAATDVTVGRNEQAAKDALETKRKQIAKALKDLKEKKVVVFEKVTKDLPDVNPRATEQRKQAGYKDDSNPVNTLTRMVERKLEARLAAMLNDISRSNGEGAEGESPVGVVYRARQVFFTYSNMIQEKKAAAAQAGA